MCLWNTTSNFGAKISVFVPLISSSFVHSVWPKTTLEVIYWIQVLCAVGQTILCAVRSCWQRCKQKESFGFIREQQYEMCSFRERIINSQCEYTVSKGTVQYPNEDWKSMQSSQRLRQRRIAWKLENKISLRIPGVHAFEGKDTAHRSGADLQIFKGLACSFTETFGGRPY